MNTKQYFYRNVIFSKQGNTISMIDIHYPEKNKEKLDTWFGMVLQLADGQHTLDQLYQYISTLYNGSPPENLKETLHSVVLLMTNSKLIVLTKNKTELPYYLSLPYEMLDIEKAKNLFKEDQDRYSENRT